MVLRDRFHLLRWVFAPIQVARDGSIQWIWRAYAQDGTLKMESERVFDSLTDCIEDAKARGYDPAQTE